MTYHLSRNGQPTGTCSKEEAIARYARGEILPTDLVWCEGMANWAAASTVFGASVPPPPPMSGTAATPVAPAAPAAMPRPAPSTAGKPSNNLVFAILATLLCCLPSGIVAIVYAAQVDSKWNSGDYAGAQAAAKNAATWSWVSLGLGLLGGIGYAAFMLLVASSAAAGGF